MRTSPTRRHLLAGLGALAVAGCATRPPPRRPPATAMPVTDPALLGLDAVIDIHHTDPVSDFRTARLDGRILAVIHKATEGVGWVDPLYARRRIEAEAAGLLWGAYHFGTAEHPGAEQAAAFLDAVRPGPATLMALDLELNERHPDNTMDLARAEDFVQTIVAATGRMPLLYTHPAWADGDPLGGHGRSLGGAIRRGSALAACDLWLVDYRDRPELPSAWAGRGWHFWQYAGAERNGGPFQASTRRVAGVARCDRNLFAADEAALLRYWGMPAADYQRSRLRQDLAPA